MTPFLMGTARTSTHFLTHLPVQCAGGRSVLTVNVRSLLTIASVVNGRDVPATRCNYESFAYDNSGEVFLAMIAATGLVVVASLYTSCGFLRCTRATGVLLIGIKEMPRHFVYAHAITLIHLAVFCKEEP
jgi:hypothetical protein